MEPTLLRIVKAFSKALDSENHQDRKAVGFSVKLESELNKSHSNVESEDISVVSQVITSLAPFHSGVGANSQWSAGSDSQQRNGEYLLARCSYAQHSDERNRDHDGQYELTTAITHFKKAIDLSEKLGDTPSLVALHVWLAKCHHQNSDHDQAHTEFAAAERALLRIPPTSSFNSALLAMRFTLNVRMAGHDWERGNFNRGEQHIAHASNILAQARIDPTLQHDDLIITSVFDEAFQVHWMRALLDYVGGWPIRAYREGSAAVSLLSASASPVNRGRFLGLIAEFAMNLVAAQYRIDPVDYPVFMLPGALHDSVSDLDLFEIDKLMKSVRKLLKQARDYAKEGEDEIGRALNDLSMRRAARLTSLIERRNYSAQSTRNTADQVIKQARKANDVNLEGRALVTRGDAWLMENERAQAAADYEHALRLFQEHHLGGLSFWPQQKLLAL